jgi:hypothetical protein
MPRVSINGVPQGSGGGGGGGDEEDPGIPSSGLVVDWRASALSLSDGAAVGSWAPSTGTGTLTASGGARPTFRATGNPAGGPCVEFLASSSQALTLAGVAGLPTGANPGTLIAIVSRFRPVGGAGLQHLWQYGTAGSREARGLLVTSSNNIRTHEWSSGETETRSPRGQGLRVYEYSYDGAKLSIVVDGIDYSTEEVVLNTGSANGFAVGSSIVGGEFGSFFLMRLCGYSRVLTATERAQVVMHATLAYGDQ